MAAQHCDGCNKAATDSQPCGAGHVGTDLPRAHNLVGAGHVETALPGAHNLVGAGRVGAAELPQGLGREPRKCLANQQQQQKQPPPAPPQKKKQKKTKDMK